MEKSTKTKLKFGLLLLALAIVVYVVRFSPLAGKISPLALREFISGFGVFGFLIFILLYAVGTAFALPGTVLTLVGALIFGAGLGTLLNVLGATIGACFAFFAASYLGKDFVQGLLKGKFDDFQNKVENKGFSVILLLRLIPIFPFIGLNYAAGLTKVKFKDYAAATFLGIIPGTFVYTYLFASIGEKVLTDGLSFSDLFTVDILLPIGLFATLLISTLVVKKRIEKKAVVEVKVEGNEESL